MGHTLVCGLHACVFVMSAESTETAETEPIKETPIPSMLTNSTLEMLDHFADQIIELEAEVSIDNWNRTEALRDFGLTRKQLQRQKMTIDYHEIRDDDGVAENPLTDDAIADIEEKLNYYIADFDKPLEPDMAVSKLQVVVESDEIEAVSRATSNEFELTFISDAAGEARDLTEDLNYDKGLYDEYGFEYRNLNLRSVVETRAKYTEQSDGKLMGWGGPSDVRPRCTKQLAQAVYDLLPTKFRAIKWYTVGEDDVIDLQSVQADGGDSDE